MSTPEKQPLSTLGSRVTRIAEVLDEGKGENIVVLDLRGICDFVDAFVIATGRSSTHIHGLIGHVMEALREHGIRPVLKPDTASERWMLLDYSDVIVHVFDAETRAFYDLENLWGDAEAMAWPQVQLA